MTRVNTARRSYRVTGVRPGVLLVHNPDSGATRKLTVKDVGRARFDGAVSHFYGSQARAARAS